MQALADKDLLSVQEARDLIARANSAQVVLNQMTQAQIDAIVQAIAEAGVRHAQRLAKMANEETGFGRYEDKVVKNRFASQILYDAIKGQKTIGILREDREHKIIEMGVPVGVVVGLVPSTNPTSTVLFKAMISLKAGNAITIPEFFSNRFRDNSHLLLAISAIWIVIFFVPYTASGFAACGKLFSTLFNIPYLPAMIVSAIVIVVYTALGGFLAASTTDLIQSIVMTIALVIVVFFGVSMAGGLDVVINNAKGLAGYLSLTQIHDQATGTASSYGFLTILSTLAWGLGYFGMPHILLRFMGTEDENKLKLSRRIATIWVIISMFIAIFIGIIGYSISKAGHIPAFTDSSQSETLIIKIAMLLSNHGVIAIIFAGIILAGILACTMSTSDSQLLAASSSVSHNLLHDVLHIELSEKTSMLVARITVICIAVIGVFIARDPESSVYAIVSFAWAGFGASFGPIMLFSLFWKRTNRNGALAGMLVGGIMVFVWKYLIKPLGGIWGIYELLPAFLCACIAIVVVSLLTAPPSKEIIEEFESVGK